VIVCLVTDRRRRPVLEHCRDAVLAGVDLIDLREPGLAGRALASLAGDIVQLTRGTATRLVVNDRLDVALACGADGVHLRGDSIPAAGARTIAPPGFLVGRSVRRDIDVSGADAEVDYFIAGTVFPTTSKPGLREHLGVDGLGAIARATRVPVLGIGGITLEQLEAVSRAGAAGVAAIGLFDAPGGELERIVREARQRFDSARSDS
jgi:thiamine-phosphate pyrophosphorylase